MGLRILFPANGRSTLQGQSAPVCGFDVISPVGLRSHTWVDKDGPRSSRIGRGPGLSVPASGPEPSQSVLCSRRPATTRAGRSDAPRHDVSGDESKVGGGAR